jgi:periplasmic protein CpxP/Spy
MLEISYGFLLARRATLLAAVFLAACCAAWAQSDASPAPPAGGPPPGGMYRHGPGIERQLRELTRVLSLSTEQQTQVKALLESEHTQMEELRRQTEAATDQTAPPTPPDREKMLAIHQATDTKITALLNEEQKTKFAAWQQERQQRMMRRGVPDGTAPPAPDGSGI